MAQAYGKVTGKVGVATVTQGPGLTNCFTALREAVVARLPMILICGDTLTSPIIRKMISAKWSKLLAQDLSDKSPDTASRDVAKAFYRA